MRYPYLSIKHLRSGVWLLLLLGMYFFSGRSAVHLFVASCNLGINVTNWLKRNSRVLFT